MKDDSGEFNVSHDEGDGIVVMKVCLSCSVLMSVADY